MNDCKQFIKAGFIVFDCDFRNYFLISCRNDAAIMFVLGNINLILSIMVYTFNSYKEDSYAAIGKAA